MSVSGDGEEHIHDQVMSESRRQTHDEIFDDLEQGLDLSPEGYDSLLQYASETVDDYGSIDSSLGTVGLSKDLKENVTDLIAYKEIFEDKLGFLDEFKDELVTEEYLSDAKDYFEENEYLEETVIEYGDIAAIEALREGQLFDRIMEMGEERDWDISSIKESTLFDSVNDVSDAVIADYYFRGGKGLRSTMGQITQYGFEETVDYETVVMGGMVEIFHSSTLVQDDMMDGDTERRGRASANVMTEKFFGENGRDIPITTGNVMESWVNEMNIHEELEIPETSKEAMVRVQDIVNRGQNEDILMAQNISDLSIDDYKQMSLGKTGFLYGAMLKMAAENSMQNLDYTEEQRDRVNDLLGDYTFNFNLAFQASDDLLEVVSSDMDKSDSDISNRKKTATAITTDRALELSSQQIDGMPAEEYFRTLFSIDSEDDPTENIVASEGSSSIQEDEEDEEDIFLNQVSEKAFDSNIRRLMKNFEELHRDQLKEWADRATEATEQLKKDSEQDEYGLNDSGANLLSKTAEAMNNRTH